MQCPIIAEHGLCWKCRKRGHKPLTCRRSTTIAESCEFCRSASHTINCPSVLCKRCNNHGHTMKYCTMDKRRICCVKFSVESHEAVDSESAKILITPNRQQSSQNREICQFCHMPGHSVKTCRKMNNNQQNTF